MTAVNAEWLILLTESRTAADEAARAAAARRRAGHYMWTGAKALIAEWNSDDDPDAENLYALALGALGKSRKSAASKIKTVALASRDLDLHPDCYGSLSEAYRNARRMAELMSDQG